MLIVLVLEGTPLYRLSQTWRALSRSTESAHSSHPPIPVAGLNLTPAQPGTSDDRKSRYLQFFRQLGYLVPQPGCRLTLICPQIVEPAHCFDDSACRIRSHRCIDIGVLSLQTFENREKAQILEPQHD